MNVLFQVTPFKYIIMSGKNVANTKFHLGFFQRFWININDEAMDFCRDDFSTQEVNKVKRVKSILLEIFELH